MFRRNATHEPFQCVLQSSNRSPTGGSGPSTTSSESAVLGTWEESKGPKITTPSWIFLVASRKACGQIGSLTPLVGGNQRQHASCGFMIMPLQTGKRDVAKRKTSLCMKRHGVSHWCWCSVKVEGCEHAGISGEAPILAVPLK